MKIKFTLLLFCFIIVIAAKAQETGTVTDYDGNTYQTVKIGDQWWMAENLRTTHYADGTEITHFTGTQTTSADDYATYYAYPNNDEANVPTYGLLYSWSVMGNQDASEMKQLLTNENWNVPDTTDWATLAAYLGGKSVAGGKLKSTSTAWVSPNTGATNEAGFNALPAGDCNTNGFTVFGEEARFWTPQLVHAGMAGRTYMFLDNETTILEYGQYRNVNTLSLRLIYKTLTASKKISGSKLSVLSTKVSDNLKIKGINQNSMISVYSLNGVLKIKNSTQQQNEVSVDIKSLPRGMYIVQVQNCSETFQQKFIKQ
ncbi:MAG: FISUMP domain-containing protein [Paludibacter sp.]|nr:FISUMP domain-containing protein [Paludibacter sp.]